ncbi:hypothetical protein UREG_06804 [Uncinocarpus reesii 1704]|uniref:Uncharacterized protein n=1 Tax=Uncinocarpus reesii (strain UAMH 1704) TaxID=336963 RepID=C4JW62_UNCRE|nr:uncharacterized protein UREG_06804 [Uncinocarpus reesii 1704]EEP81939.1 hypothetical protein UREG_06804 [Uncinocarpus reesii 1704]
MEVLWGSASKKVQNEILKVCDDSDVKKALNAYSKSCSESGNKVALIEIPSTLTTMSATGSPTGSSIPVETTASGTASGGAPTETGNAGSSLKSKSFAVAAIAAMVGAAAM